MTKPIPTPCHVVAAHREPILNAGIADVLRKGLAIEVQVLDSAGQCGAASLLITDGRSALQACFPFPVLVLDPWPSERMLAALFDAGVKNYVLQDASVAELGLAVGKLLAGGQHCSPGLLPLVLQLNSVVRPTQREHDVLALLAKGYCNKRIAQQLGIGHDTVKTHMKSVMGKLGVASRTQALALAVQRGIVEIDMD